MARIYADLNDLISEWRDKFNDLSYKVGDLTNLATGGDSDLVQAINELHTEVTDNSTTLATLSILDSAGVIALIGGQFPAGTDELADSSVTEAKMANDAIGSAQLKDVQGLAIYDSDATLLKVIYGAGA